MVQTNLAHTLVAQGNVAEAIPLYELALKLGPDIPDTHKNVGIAAMRAGNIDLALQFFRQSIDIDPTFVAGYEAIARALEQKGDVPQAIKVLNNGITQNPRDATLHESLGEILVAHGATSPPPLPLFKSDRVETQRRQCAFQSGNDPADGPTVDAGGGSISGGHRQSARPGGSVRYLGPDSLDAGTTH